MNTNTLLLEIGTEELPPKQLNRVSTLFSDRFCTQLKEAQLTYERCVSYATPRRIALMIYNLAHQQPQQIFERRGPSITAAYDAHGKPTQAALGFARACGTSVDKLTELKTDKGTWLGYRATQSAVDTTVLIPTLLKNALTDLPLPRLMHWENSAEPFLRPVHWIVALYGHALIDLSLFGVRSDRFTYGHRFHYPEPLEINHPEVYETLLKQHNVMPNFHERRERIRAEALAVSKNVGNVMIDDALLDEVNGLVEWPVALLGQFESSFIDNVPQEALMLAMQHHQKCFPILNDEGTLQPYFVMISNIKSKDPSHVIKGNERVIRARLADAQFFYHTDIKKSLASHLEQLKHVTFQAQLGTVFERTERMAALAGYIAKALAADVSLAEQAARLAKADLMSDMVGEFPELQGIMGAYYARNDQLPDEVAKAIRMHYQPCFSGDALPDGALASAVALSDKLDVLIGLFGINAPPSGQKDPFALRRAALGVLRILIEGGFSLDLKILLTEAAQLYNGRLTHAQAVDEAAQFIMGRMKGWYAEQGIPKQVVNAVLFNQPTQPLDVDQRIRAVAEFQKHPEASTLITVFKRVHNILKQQSPRPTTVDIDRTLLIEPQEKRLADLLVQQQAKWQTYQSGSNYSALLASLAKLGQPLAEFFDQVMVMVDDSALRENRLMLLNKIQNLLLHVADISMLQREDS